MDTPEANYFTDTHKVSAKGNEYVYAWRGKGAPRLPGAYGSPESVQAWLNAASIRTLGVDGTIQGLVDAFRKTPRWLGNAGRKSYSEDTKRSYGTYLKLIEREFGDMALVGFENRSIRRPVLDWRDRIAQASPRNADYAVTVLCLLLNWGVKTGRVETNRAAKIEKLYESDRSDFIWKPEDFAILKRATSDAVFQAAKLASLTGLRQTDCLKMQKTDLRDHLIRVETSKSRKRKAALIIRYPELNAFLETLPKHDHPTVLVNSRGVPWQTGFGASWDDAKRNGLALIEDEAHRRWFAELHFHDLRGTAITRLWAAKLSTAQIAKYVGWSEKSVLNLLDRYVSDEEGARIIAQQIADAGKTADAETEKTDPSVKPFVKPEAFAAE